MPDVMHRLIYEKLGLSPSTTKRNTTNEELELNAAKDSARNSDGCIERELNSAVRNKSIDFTKIMIQSSSKKPYTEDEYSTMYGQFALVSMSPQDTNDLKDALQIEINNPCSISDRNSRIRIAGFLNKKAKLPKKDVPAPQKKIRTTNSKSFRDKKGNIESKNIPTRRVSIEDHSERRHRVYKIECISKPKKSEPSIKKNNSLKKKSGIKDSEVKTRRTSIIKPAQGKSNPKYKKEPEVCHTDRIQVNKKPTKLEYIDRGADKENINAFSNLEVPITYREFTFKIPDKDHKTDENRLEHKKPKRLPPQHDFTSDKPKSTKRKKGSSKLGIR